MVCRHGRAATLASPVSCKHTVCRKTTVVNRERKGPWSCRGGRVFIHRTLAVVDTLAPDSTLPIPAHMSWLVSPGIRLLC